MRVGIPRETFPGERRVAVVPAGIPALTRAGYEVLVEPEAGAAAGYPDAHYTERGAKLAESRHEIFQRADVLLQVRTLGANPDAGAADLDLLRPGQILLGFADPLTQPQQMQAIAERGVALLAMELIPRITRAQSMDALSSTASIAGYKAVLIAASELPRMFPMMMTAAGTITAARVFVIGAGVAGLQAIATAKRLGAQVFGYDLRPAVREQVQSLGAKFIELPLETATAEGAGGYAKQMDEEFYRRQRELMSKVIADSDVVITTAAVPGKKAPILVTEAMVEGMRPGSIIVDLAAERGGNCELTEPDRIVEKHDVRILGPTNPASTVPFHASQMYSKNVTALLLHMTKDGKVELNMEDEITRETLVTREGQIVHPRIKETIETSV
jgi:H+-translocating NAD(P) transhydrogenase subunit alpha